MKGKLLLGGVLILAGFVLAVVGATGLRQPDTRDPSAVIIGDQNQPARDEATSIVFPVIAGLSIAAGAALVGIGIGSFRQPRIVPPDSPVADEAATTRPLTDEGNPIRRGNAGA